MDHEGFEREHDALARAYAANAALTPLWQRIATEMLIEPALCGSPARSCPPGLARRWPVTGASLARHWRHWPVTGPSLARHWPVTGPPGPARQVLVSEGAAASLNQRTSRVQRLAARGFDLW